jgi:hypothetical protein
VVCWGARIDHKFDIAPEDLFGLVGKIVIISTFKLGKWGAAARMRAWISSPDPNF